MERRRTAAPALLVASLLTLALRCGGAAAETAAPEWTKAERNTGYVAFQHNNLQLAERSHVPGREVIGEKIRCELARGEYEAVQVGIHGLADSVKNVRLQVASDLEVRVFRRIDGNVRQMLLGYPNPV